MENSLSITGKQWKRFSNLISNDIGDGLLLAPFALSELSTRIPCVQTKITEEVELEMCARLFDREELFRFSYVPFVIAELVWDYADTVITQAQIVGNPATIKLSRAIRKARAEFVSLRRSHMIGEAGKRQIENGYLFEEGVGHVTRHMLSNIRIDIQKEYPELEENSRDLLVAVYQCHILSRALLHYMAKQKTATERRVGHVIGDIMPKPYYVMDKLIPEFIGDKPCSREFSRLMKQYIETLSTQIGLVELNDISENDEDSSEENN